MAQRAQPPSVGTNPNIPIETQRDLRTLATYAFSTQAQAESAIAQLQGKVGFTRTDLLQVAQFVSGQVQANGAYPINLTGLIGELGQLQDALIPIVLSLPAKGKTKGQVVIYLNTIWVWDGVKWRQAVTWLYEDTHANRVANYPPANYVVGTLFWETDRTVLYIIKLVAGTPQWVYLAGVYEDVFANRPLSLGAHDSGFQFFTTDYTVSEYWNGTGWVYVSGVTVGAHAILATLAGVLSASEAGWLVNDTTYAHGFRWTGSGWNFNEGETSQYFVMAPSTPKGGVWYPCNGGSYTCENSDGSTSSVTTPNLNGITAALFGGGYSASPNAATAPTWAAGAKTDDESAHTHPTGVAFGTLNYQSGSSVAVVVAGVDDPTGPGSAHHHTLSNANATINPPSVANGGLPEYFTTSWFLRA